MIVISFPLLCCCLLYTSCYKNEYASGGNLLVRGDLMEKYGYEDITSREELEAFLDDVCTGEASCLLYTSRCV